MTTTVVVGAGDIAPNGPWSLEPTSNTGTYSFVTGPATPPDGTGSLAMSIASGQHEWLNNYAYGACATGPSCTNPLANWTSLANIDTLGFSTYTDAGSTTYPTFNIETDPSGTGSGYTTFVFVPTSGLVNDSVWQPWDPMNPSDGVWYSTTNLGVAPFNCNFQAAGCSASWSQITAAFPNAKIKYGLGPNLGTGGTFTGNIDDFTVGVSGTTTVYDFEPNCTTTCYVDAASGSDLNTGEANDPLQTIQAGVNAVSPGGTVEVAAGTYVENVTLPQSVHITGAGPTTMVEPAISDPDCGGAGGSSLCAGASNVFLVQHDDVTIDHLLVNGDNPTLNGVNVGGANVDARNGIITDFNAPSSENNFSVHDVTVDNVYLRGIYASNSGSFNFTNDTVDNVQGDPNGSVAMFNFGGSGTMTGNHVSNALDAISSNWSTGTTYTNNVITSSGSGVHSDNNGGSGGTGDVISGNTVSSCTAGGYGVFSFVPYVAQTITNNTISGCDTGLAAFASCDLGGTNYCPGDVIPTTTFSGNHVTTTSGGEGLDVSTTSFGYGDGQVQVNATNNVISGPGKSVFVEETGTATATTTANRNSITSVDNTGTSTVNATCDWWGQVSGPGVGAVTGSVTTTPLLTSSNLAGACPGHTAPSAPRPTSAVPFNDHSAKVIWQVPVSNGGSPITGYVITPYLAGVAQPAHVFNSTATSEFVTGLTDTKSYQFTVAAKNAVGTGPKSVKTAPMIAGAPGQPGMPTVQLVSGSLKVTFKAPLNDGAAITSFTASCSSGNGGATKTKSGPASPLTVAGVTAHKSYTCTVTAKNSRGTGPKSKPSATIST